MMLLPLAAAIVVIASFDSAETAGSTFIRGDVIVLESVQDADAMTTLTPGDPVSWDVGVSASQHNGTLSVTLSADTPHGAFAIDARSCSVRWQAEQCLGSESVVLATTSESGEYALAEQPSSAQVWYRISVEALQTMDVTARLNLSVSGAGETVSAGAPTTPAETSPGVNAGVGAQTPDLRALPVTGMRPAGIWAIAATAIVCGLAFLGLARLRRRSWPER